MSKEIKQGTLTALLLKQAVPMMKNKHITSVEIMINDEIITLIYHMKDGKILRDSWKDKDIS